MSDIEKELFLSSAGLDRLTPSTLDSESYMDWAASPLHDDPVREWELLEPTSTTTMASTSHSTVPPTQCTRSPPKITNKVAMKTPPQPRAPRGRTRARRGGHVVNTENRSTTVSRDNDPPQTPESPPPEKSSIRVHRPSATAKPPPKRPSTKRLRTSLDEDNIQSPTDKIIYPTKYRNQRPSLQTRATQTVGPKYINNSYNPVCCWHCGEVGHSRNSCPNPGILFCSQCGRIGRYSDECCTRRHHQ